MRVVFFLKSLGFLRGFDGVIRELLDRGHSVHLLLERGERASGAGAWLDAAGRRPGFSWSATDAVRRDRWWKLATNLRRSSDYVRFLSPAFTRAPHFVDRAERRASPAMRRLMRSRLGRFEPVRRATAGVLRGLERAVPVNRLLQAELASLRPDVLLVVPDLAPGERDSEYVRCARALGVPTCIAVASWDNLSSKQLLHELPDRVLVWNEIQRREAIELHGVPSDRVAATGAQSFDPWFEWQPRDRDSFCRRVGLDPERPYLLYVGGSLFPAALTEAEFARTWVEEVRKEPALERVGVLVRPHPNRGREWTRVSFDGLENVSVWPRSGWEMPITDEDRADLFDSIYHSAAVAGVNTSAMIESAIVGRPVHVILVPEFAGSQRGTLHFDYLLTIGGGVPRVSESIAEQRAAIAEDLREGDPGYEERRRRFLEEFVRPFGLDRRATPLFADSVQEVAAGGARRPAGPPLRYRPLLAVLELVLLPKRVRGKVRLELGRLRPSR